MSGLSISAVKGNASYCREFDRPLTLWVNLTMVDTIHSKATSGEEFMATVDSKLIDSPGCYR